MKIFLDANVLVAVLNKEYPLFSYAARVLSLADNKRFEFYTTTVCLAIAFYFAEKKHGSISAKEKTALLVSHINIAECGKKEALMATSNSKISDFEDGLEYYAAKNNNCKYIVSEDNEDFWFSDIPVLSCENFLVQVMAKQ